ncbi:segregation/condensation protein A [Bacillus kwashiorkori]|uniref:segregation/condensation protein A n=1 Tax=Bacillus kwashiorkori TaxID=1522318 RepID=UPI00078373B2|nr:segregation/condensation protein A [Bacillus kwashiorkori]
MQVNIKIAGFEGPLDLLLHLIKQMEVDIYDIPMVEITEQYLLYVHTMQELKLDVASEYLVMAATLLAIKSQMLLPQYEEAVDEDVFEYEEDPREELIAKLIEYRKYKEAADELKAHEQERELMFTKPPIDLSEYASEVSEKSALQITIYDMLGAYHKLLRRNRLKKPLQTKVTRQEISIEIRMNEITSLLREKNSWTNFFDLFPYPDKEHIVTTFLAMLELLKRNEIFIQQQTNFDEIWVRSIKE